jgi:hypothetical protein
MTTILPSLVDRHRNLRNGRKRWVGQVVAFDRDRRSVIAEVYGTTLAQMRRRKRLVWIALKHSEEHSQPKHGVKWAITPG